MSRYALWRAALVVLLPLALVSTAHGQRPTAKVTARVDVDGDGKPDEVRIDEDGSITVHISGNDAAGAWTPLAASGKVVGGTIVVDTALDKGRTIILATSKLGRRGRRTFTEAVALAWTPGKLETLWRGKLGAQGPDGGSSLSLELGEYGLIKYASRAGVSRCDGETAHLDAERYDFASSRFRPARQALRMDVADKRKPLVTSKTAPAFVASGASAFWFRGASASSSATAESAADLVPPLAIADGDLKTAWTENKGGVGTGEFVTLRSSMGIVGVKALRLSLGHGAAFNDFNRPKRLGLILSPTEKFWIEIPKDPKEAQWVVLPAPVSSQCVSLVLDEVYPRKPKSQTALSEVTVFSEEELDPKRSAGLLATRIAEGKAGADQHRLLASLGTGAEAALLDAIAKIQSAGKPAPKEITNLRLALASLPAAPVQLARGLANDSLRTRQHEEFAQGLRTLQTASIAPLTQSLLSSGLSAEATTRIANVLGQLPDAAAAQALLSALGTGSDDVRTSIIRALAKRPDAWQQLPAALGPANTAALQADLFRAMGLAGERLPPGSEQRAALASSVAETAGGRDLNYEEHYRLLQAAGQIGGPVSTEALLAQYQLLIDRDDAEGLALLRRAVDSLGRLAPLVADAALKARVASTLGEALRHRDPGVRLATLATLQQPITAPGSVEEQLRIDTWPQVRRAAAAALSMRCDASSIAALRQATLEDADTSVARTAFGGVLGCGGTENFALAVQIVDDAKRPLKLRLQAARALGELAGPNEAGDVLKRFASARRGALSNPTSGKIASALSRALVDLATPEAIRALESSAADPAFPQLQTSAITALGDLCPPSAMQLLRRLRQSREHSVSAAATAASRRCTSP